MKIITRGLGLVVILLAVLLVGLNLWGALTLGSITPDRDAFRDPDANRVVLVMGATGSVGDGLLKAAMADPQVERIHVITRRSSPRIDAGVAAGRVTLHLHEDFTDYSDLGETLSEVNTVLWALGTSSLKVDEATYTWIHVDFPVAFAQAWLRARQAGPMAFHNVTGMGTGEDERAKWAQDKGRAERRVAEMAEGTGLRAFGHRSGFVRPTAEQAGVLARLGEVLLSPGDLVISARELGGAMLEISARTRELPNGTVIDNADARAYARLYNDWLNRHRGE